jgi:hypothetical protein
MNENARRFQGAGRWSAAVVALAASLVAAPAFGDGWEHGMGDVPVLGRDPGEQYAPAVAAGDSGYLVAWVDFFDLIGGSSYRDIRAARVTADGAPIDGDEPGFSLGFAPVNSGLDGPTVAFGGASYLVAWNDKMTIQTALVAPSGPSPLLATASFPDNGAVELFPVAARAGSTFVVAWLEEGFGYSLRGARIDANGGSLALGEPFTIAELTLQPPLKFKPALACAGADCLVVFSDLGVNHVYGAFIAADNTVAPPFLISNDAADPLQPASGEQTFPAVAFDGQSYLVAWAGVSDQGELESHVRGARVDLSGAVLDPGGVEIAALGSFPQIAARAGSPALVTWASPIVVESIHTARVADTAAGLTVLDPGGAPLQIQGSYPDGKPVPVALDSTGAEALAVCSAKNGAAIRRDLFGSIVETSPALTSTPAASVIAHNWNHQLGPVVTFFSQANSSPPNGYLVVWRDSTYSASFFDGATGLGGARLDAQGDVVSTHPMTPPGAVFESAILSSAAGPDNMLVGWLDTDPFVMGAMNVRAVLVNPSGELASPSPILIPTGDSESEQSATSLSAAFDGSAYVLVWSTGDRVRASRVSAGGDVLEADVEIYGDPMQGTSVRNLVSAYVGSGDFLTVWSDGSGVFCKSFSTASDQISVSSGDPKRLVDLISDSPTPAVAYDGAGAALVVGQKSNALYGTRISKSCDSLDGGFPIAQASSIDNPRVIFDGSSYLAVWQSGNAMYGAWISRDGIAHASSGFLVAEKDGLLGIPVLASDGAGRSLVAFTRSHFTHEDNSQFDVNRVRVKLIENDCELPEPVSCQPENPCLAGGSCDPQTLKCLPPSARPDGVPCPEGLCIGGECVPGSTLPLIPESGGSSGGSANPFESEGGCACEAAVGAGRRGGSGLFIAALIAIGATAKLGRGRCGRPARSARSRHK